MSPYSEDDLPPYSEDEQSPITVQAQDILQKTTTPGNPESQERQIESEPLNPTPPYSEDDLPPYLEDDPPPYSGDEQSPITNT